MFQQSELFVGQHNRQRPAACGVVEAIQFQIAGAQLQACFPLAAQQGAAAGAEFVKAEGLGHQVVGAAVQAAYAGVHFLTGGENQNGQVGVERAHFLKNLLSVFDRHVQIKDGEIGQVLPEGLNGGPTVVRKTNTMSVGLQTST
jgi:hypothetical protein